MHFARKFRNHMNLALAALFVAAAIPVFAQVVPAAQEGGLPLVIGGGVSSYDTEIYPSNFEGFALWADWSFGRGPSYLHGLGIEVEGRDLDWGQPAGSSWRVATAGGGPIYSWRHYSSFHPYAKFLVDYGAQSGIKGKQFPSWYKSDKWMIYAPGGGVEVRAWRNLWVRADYEYQFWNVQWHDNHFLNPQGTTVGVSYDFRRMRPH